MNKDLGEVRYGLLTSKEFKALNLGEVKDEEEQAYRVVHAMLQKANPDLPTFLAKLSTNNVICLMCYEKDFRRCHRSILANKLEELGVTFHHM